MQGTISTYLPEKQYGFIKGDDGKDYFFHENEFRNGKHKGNLCEGAFVRFDQQATPKGYKARDCTLINASDVCTYVTPDEFIAAKSRSVRGWEILEPGHWIVHGMSRGSPDDAKKDAIESAQKIGANALLELEYYKRTGEERGTGKGVHRFTIHCFRGRPVTLAKRHSRGPYQIDHLKGLNLSAAELKEKLENKTARSKTKQAIVWLVVIALSVVSWHTQPWYIIGLLVAAFIFGWSNDYDSWLERNQESGGATSG